MPRHLSPLIASGLLLCTAVPARGQQCIPPANPAFEFQVDMPASAIPDSTHPHPAAYRFAGRKDDPEAIIVQFVVDTSGVPIARSFKILKSPSPALSDSLRAVFSLWRFTPSSQGGCHVPQLVQTAVVR